MPFSYCLSLFPTAVNYSYTQELPTRFKKEIVSCAAEGDRVEAAGLQRVLRNIGASQKLTAQDLQAIFAEMGNEHGEITAQRLVQLL